MKKLTLLFVSIITITLITISAIVIYGKYHDTNSKNTATNSGSINYNPPTDQEKQSGDQKKQEIVNSNSKLPNEASVVISDSSQYADTVEVRAFVSNLVKDGNCVITFKKNDTSFSHTVPAKADASTTPCLTLSLPATDFPSKGIWQVNVEYKNSELRGSSTSSLEVK